MTQINARPGMLLSLLLLLIATTQAAPPDQVAEWRAPDVDVEQLLREDESNRFRTDIPRRIGFPMATNLTPANSGTWDGLADGNRRWRLKVHSKGALWTVLGFGTFRLQPGGELTIYDPERKTVMGPYTAEHIRKHGELWFPPIAGDTLVVELFWPAALREQQPRLRLTKVSHGYKPFGAIGRDSDAPEGLGDSGSCNIDTMCPEAADWQDAKRGVVMILVGGSGNCTGSLINTTAGDCRTYMLTAAHCGENGPGTTLGFNFERPECGAGTPPPETTQMLTGGTLLTDWSASDVTLIAMDEDVPEEFGAYFNGWNRSPLPAEHTYVISHPRGDAKKIAHDADPPVDGTNYGPDHWRIDDSTSDPAHRGYEWGTTEPASSGAPLFDHDQRIVGQLHGGTASCSSDTWDEYGKVDVSWTGGGTPSTRLSDWLDPEDTGVTFVDGVDHSLCLFQPAGAALFTRDLYSCTDALVVDLRDDNIPGSPTTVDVTLVSSTETVPETLTLSQTQPGVGKYAGSIPTSDLPPVSGDGLLSVSDGDLLTVTYVDANDGQGGINVEVVDHADVDCAPPVIDDVQATAVTGSVATVTWSTDEPADSTVYYGLVPPGLASEFDPELVTGHEVNLRFLEECSDYYYWVASGDSVGNVATDDNLGSYYTFETGQNSEPAYPSTDTPIPIQDNSTHTSTISVADDKMVVKVRVGMNITHTYTGDIEATLIAPNGTRVLLVADRGGSGNNFTDTIFDDEADTPIGSGSAPFTGSFRPEQPLSAAAGINATGDWVLEVVDDAGQDTGSLDDWMLMLTYPPQACGPKATYLHHTLEADECPTGGGNLNGFWDAGERVRFSLTVENMGTDPLTGVTAEVIPLTAGLVMLDATADFDDIAEGGTATSLPPHYTVQLPLGLTCGQELEFEVAIDANEGSWLESFKEIAGEVLPFGCSMPECAPGPTGPPPIPDGDDGTEPLRAERLAADGSSILVTWDDLCLPPSTNLIYGPLDGVSSYTTTDALCGISNAEVWDPVPSGDLWFLLVSDDGAGVESSWGEGALGERNGLIESGYCATTAKDVTGSCP